MFECSADEKVMVVCGSGGSEYLDRMNLEELRRHFKDGLVSMVALYNCVSGGLSGEPIHIDQFDNAILKKASAKRYAIRAYR